MWTLIGAPITISSRFASSCITTTKTRKKGRRSNLDCNSSSSLCACVCVAGDRMRKTKVSFGPLVLPLLLLESRQCIPDQKRSIKTLRHSLSPLLLPLLLPLCAMHIVYNRLICRMNIQTHTTSLLSVHYRIYNMLKKSRLYSRECLLQGE